MYTEKSKNMKEINNLLGSLYKGDTEGATKSFEKALNSKKSEALSVKRVAVSANIFNQAQER